MTERALWIIGAVAGGIVLLATILRMRHYKRLHNQWVHEMNAQAEVPFENEARQKDSPDTELITRP